MSASDRQPPIGQSTRDTPTRVQSPATSSQFASTPRFSFGKSKAATRDQRSPSLQKPEAVQAFRASTYTREDVEDATEPNDDDEMLDDGGELALPPTETDVEDPGRHPQWTHDLAFSPKRRRLHDRDATLSPTRSTFKQSQPQAPPSSVATPRPAHSQAQPMRSANAAESIGFQRPAFLRQSADPQQPSEPLPDTFSPHKRGDRFVPGGMAATMQQWVIETGQAAAQSRKGQGYMRGEDYVLRVKVDEIIGEVSFTVRGRIASGDVVNLLLAGSSSTAAHGREEVKVDSFVGVRAPTWNLELDGRNWTVGVDWRLLA